jgi:hypothetical protein
MKKGKDPMNVCQNCIYGNNKKGKWKKTWKRRGIHHLFSGKERKETYKGKGNWHIFCEKKEKYYPWNGKKRCIERESEALKMIKQLAKEESEYYDKHGYFSWWSKALKIKRIKEQRGNNGK